MFRTIERPIHCTQVSTVGNYYKEFTKIFFFNLVNLEVNSTDKIAFNRTCRIFINVINMSWVYCKNWPNPVGG